MLHSRITRIEQLIKDEVGKIILTEMKDPRLGFVTVCRVKASKDLRHALIFVSFLDEETAEESLASLKHARGFIRKRLGEEIVLKYLPELNFLKDDNTQYADRIFRLLNTIEIKEDAETAEEDEIVNDT